jgi:hypothetical protein
MPTQDFETRSVKLVTDAEGGLHIAHPQFKAEYGKGYEITNVPNSVTNNEVLKLASSVALFVRMAELPIISWDILSDKNRGNLFMSRENNRVFPLDPKWKDYAIS